jgi:uncharacterized membrane protein
VTLIILLGILLGSFLLLSAATRLGVLRNVTANRRGQISLGLLFVFTGMGHFVQTDGMVQMLPAWVPARTAIVWASGIVEWLLAAGLIAGRYPRLVGIAVIVFLVAVFPGNLYAAINRVDFGGHAQGPAYLLVRAPFQALLIATGSQIREPHGGSDGSGAAKLAGVRRVARHMTVRSEHDRPRRQLSENKKALWFGGVQLRKRYVSYHLMPVYVNPALLKGISPDLKRRMQGKSCFNFTASDASLFNELAALTEASFRDYQKKGYV